MQVAGFFSWGYDDSTRGQVSDRRDYLYRCGGGGGRMCEKLNVNGEVDDDCNAWMEGMDGLRSD